MMGAKCGVNVPGDKERERKEISGRGCRLIDLLYALRGRLISPKRGININRNYNAIMVEVRLCYTEKMRAYGTAFGQQSFR